jgi:hypothetical protein
MNFLRKFNLKKKIEYHPTYYYSKRANKKNYIIHHYCPHTYNAGDHFVILSIRQHLKKYLPNAIFIPKAVAGNRGWGKPIGLKGENIYYSNKFADAVIIGGSDLYNNWSPKIKADEIKHLVPPLFLIGLGVSSPDLNYVPYLKKESYKTDILATNTKAKLSSVRDLTTQQFLKNLGFEHSIVTGCPALFLFENQLSTNNSKSVLLTFPYPLLHRTKNSTQQKKFLILLQIIKDIISFLESKNLDPIIVCHDDRDVPPSQILFPNHPIFFSNYPEKYFNLYKNARIVVGSRLHATILAASMGIPFLNINLDLRGVGFSKTFKLENWNVNYNEPKISDKIKERISVILDDNLSPFREFINEKNRYRTIFSNVVQEAARQIKDFR